MKLTNIDFELLKSKQFCDTPSCSYYQKVGGNNIKIHSRKQNQVYCNECNTRFVVTKGTVFYCLKTPIKKVVSVLMLLCRGMGVNHTCREEQVTADTIQSWLKKASQHVEELTNYLQKEMNLDQVQIDEFWSFIRKKKGI